MGAAAGLLAAALPYGALMRLARGDEPEGMGRLVACALAPFALLQALMLVVRILRPAAVAAFGITSTLVFLAAMSVAAARSWRHLR